MKLERGPLGACLALLLAMGAGIPSCSSTSKEDSQTHFFSTCEDDADCGDLACLCGRCTTSCSTEACSSGQKCAESRSRPAGDLCGLSESPDLCLPECSGPSDCAKGTVCTDGACTREVPTLADCDVETLLDYVLGDTSGTVDCGTLDTLSPASESAAVRECALSSVENGTAFRAVWSPPGIDSLLKDAIAGVSENGSSRYYYFHYDSLGFEPNGATAAWGTCRAFNEADNCTPESGLCFSCDADDVVNCECRLDGSGARPATIHCK